MAWITIPHIYLVKREFHKTMPRMALNSMNISYLFKIYKSIEFVLTRSAAVYTLAQRVCALMSGFSASL